MRTENAPSVWEHEFLPSQVSIGDSLATRKVTAHWEMKRRAIALWEGRPLEPQPEPPKDSPSIAGGLEDPGR